MYSWLLLIIYKYQPNSFLAPVVHFFKWLRWKLHSTCIYIFYLLACRLNQLIFYLQRSNWNIMDFPCLVGKMATNKAFICCSMRLSTSGKRSSSTKVKISLNIHSSKSSESSHWSSSILQTIFCPGREKQNLPKEMRWEISLASPR